MNITNKIRNSFFAGVQEIKDLYQHRPPIYDIAIGVFRTSVLGSIIGGSVIATKAGFVLPILSISYFAYLEASSLILWSKVNKISVDQNKKDVVLICHAKNDPNGAANRLASQKFEIFKKLEQKQSLVFEKIDSVRDINDAIERITQQGRRIKTLWVSAHGTPNVIGLGKEEIDGKDRVYHYFDDTRKVCVDNIKFEKLDPKADIILSSCSVAGKSGIVNGLNIAEWFQFYAGPDRRVFAPSASVPFNGTNQKVGPDGKVDYCFISTFGFDITGDVSYQKVVEKINKVEKPQDTWLNRIFSVFSQERSFDYRSLLNSINVR